MCFDGLQFIAGPIGIFHESNHRDATYQLFVLIDGIHIDEVEVRYLAARHMCSGFPGLQHFRQTGTGTQIAQHTAFHRVHGMAHFLAEKFAVGTVTKDEPPIGIDNGDTFIERIKNATGEFVQLQHTNLFLSNRRSLV